MLVTSRDRKCALSLANVELWGYLAESVRPAMHALVETILLLAFSIGLMSVAIAMLWREYGQSLSIRRVIALFLGCMVIGAAIGVVWKLVFGDYVGEPGPGVIAHFTITGEGFALIIVMLAFSASPLSDSGQYQPGAMGRFAHRFLSRRPP